MGGRGSGNRIHDHRPPRKTTVEECVVVSIDRLIGAWRIVPGETTSWEETWQYTRWRKLTIQYEVAQVGSDEFSLRIQQEGAPVWFGEPVIHAYTIGLMPNGGRWWLACPAQRGFPNACGQAEGACGRRAMKLYLPPGGRRFGCRDCHQLSYLSRQEGYLKKRQDRLLEWEESRINHS
jgi:hypothetical protein